MLLMYFSLARNTIKLISLNYSQNNRRLKFLTETTENQELIILFPASYILLLHTLIHLLEFPKYVQLHNLLLRYSPKSQSFNCINHSNNYITF